MLTAVVEAGPMMKQAIAVPARAAETYL